MGDASFLLYTGQDSTHTNSQEIRCLEDSPIPNPVLVSGRSKNKPSREQSRRAVGRHLLPTGLHSFYWPFVFSRMYGSSSYNLWKKGKICRQCFLLFHSVSLVCNRSFYHWKGKWNTMEGTAGILRVIGVWSPITVSINLKNHMRPVWSLDFGIIVYS